MTVPPSTGTRIRAGRVPFFGRRDQAGSLERLFHPAIGEADSVLASELLVKPVRAEPGIRLLVQNQYGLGHGQRNAVKMALIALLIV